MEEGNLIFIGKKLLALDSAGKDSNC